MLAYQNANVPKYSCISVAFTRPDLQEGAIPSKTSNICAH